MQSIWLKSRDAAALIGVCRNTLKNWRLEGRLKRGIHYVQPNSRSTLFNRALLLDFIENIERFEEHQKAVDAHLKAKEGLAVSS